MSGLAAHADGAEADPARAFLLDHFKAPALISVALGTGQHVPQVAFALAAMVEPGGRLGLVIDGRAAAPLVEALGAGAAGMSVSTFEPGQLRTVLIQGRSPRLEPLEPGAWLVVEAALGQMAAGMASIGFPPRWSQAFFDHRRQDLVTVSMAMVRAILQTPGPNVGQQLYPARGGA